MVDIHDQTPPAAILAGGPGGGGLPRGGVSLGRNAIQALAQPIPILTKALGALYAGRPVVDKTGLTGLYDITLQWIDPPRSAPGTNNAGTPPAADLGPSLFSAIEEQLGLKLAPAKAPLPVLVIDSVEWPAEN